MDSLPGRTRTARRSRNSNLYNKRLAADRQKAALFAVAWRFTFGALSADNMVATRTCGD